jgi:hypothetical protein
MFNVVSRIITGQEIATLQEAKTYFRTEDSGGVEDSLIQSLVSLARETIEGKIDRSLVASNVVVFASDWKGYLPFGPVASYTIDGIATVQGNKYLLVNASQNVTISYATEPYISAAMKNAVLELAFYWYERGEFTGGEVPAKIKPIIRQHSRLSFIG